ncbi:MAG TPA: type I DNA topoisomerase, partial [Candidatus Limnocylindria bacterium]|nr:type I DNA topoisomerase [Candidatus Limnocylindria bacterium]
MPPSDDLRRLVIVESPAKAKTIAGYLGPGYEVEASIGHIRDLPTPSELPAEEKKGRFGKFAVDVDNDFEPYYVVDADKKKKVAELRRKLKNADELLLATDEDREGEAIAWHLLQVLEPTVPVRRMVFHEITRDAIRRAAEDTRELDQRLVDAQETRRILDRLYGYEVSPVLWRKVRAGLSAGRVQSVATRLVVERERDRMAFVRAGYWDLEGVFDPGAFTARLVAVDGSRVATGRDFDTDGQLKTAGAVVLDEPSVRSLVAGLSAAAFAVRSVEDKPYRRSPAAPFMTSTLQQEASRKLRMSSQVAMRVAQRLYENGHITYMRTDSTTLSESAIAAARSAATQIFGAENVSETPRQYTRKVKNAQEAHEAIRPSGDAFRTPGELAREVSPDELALYDLIWKRTVASQMSDARGQTASVRLGAVSSDGRDAELAASGTVITHRGFLAAYEEGRDEPGAGEVDERRLPAMSVGDVLALVSLEADGHETQPPARFTEATLVKALEERGIGRPSTYAATISVILDRGYVFKKGTALVPTWLAFAVTRLLEQQFGELVDYDFTAQMESDLDRIAAGEADRVAWLHDFYFGAADGSSGVQDGLKGLVDNLGDIDARAINSVDIGAGITLRVGRYGPYIERGEERASVPEDLAPDELTVAHAEELLAAPSGDRPLGTDPTSGLAILAKTGRYGPYVTEVLPEDAPKKARPRTGSLFKDMSLDTVTLEDALRLLSLPRVVG